MSMDSIVHAEKGSRMTGFHSWGQWHRRNDTGDHFWHNQPHPNLRVQYLGLNLSDGNGSPHAGVAMTPANNFKEGVQFDNAAFSIEGAQRGEDGWYCTTPQNRFIVFRDNTIQGWNLGFGLGVAGTASELLVEGNRMSGLMTVQNVTNAGQWVGPISHGQWLQGIILWTMSA
eukprot:m.468355 g.468355  ORF g.468355 m.468355 type:complete len:172 (+) comp27404_c0_seq1:1956-2471(+)